VVVHARLPVVDEYAAAGSVETAEVLCGANTDGRVVGDAFQRFAKLCGVSDLRGVLKGVDHGHRMRAAAAFRRKTRLGPQSGRILT
jgi:hypothetical protein